MGAQWNQRLDGRDRQLNIGKHGNIVTGGEFADCLSDSDIDSVLHPILGANYLPARLLYDFQRGVVAAEEVRKQLNDATKGTGRCFAPMWSRHHWVTALFRQTDDSIRITVFDSAAAPSTWRDFNKIGERLGLNLTLIQHCRQPRDSNECGLHVCMLGIILGRCDPFKFNLHTSTEVISLLPWRTRLTAQRRTSLMKKSKFL